MTNKQYIRKNALIYQRYKDNFNELTEQDLYEFRSEIVKAYNAIPLKEIKVLFVDVDPYKTVAELTADVRNNRVMRVFSGGSDSKLLPGMLNLMFRAIHDYWHYVLQAPFTAEGEIKVFNRQAKHHTSITSQKILFSEVVLQACYAEYFGEFASVQKVILN